MKSISAKENVAILVSLMQKWGIKHVVVCPGSRNAPIAHTLGNTDGIVCHPITDERSAAFVALGMSDALNSCVAVCCTSGSAVLNMSPAVAEAYYRHIPLLIISADRPKEWIGQMDGQTIVQPRCFGPHAISYDIDDVHNDLTRWATTRDINEALMMLKQNNGQPVHINIHLNEPLFNFIQQPLPNIDIVQYHSIDSDTSSLVEQWNNAQRRLIIVGQLKPNSTESNWIRCNVDNLGATVIAEHLGNIDDINCLITRADDILATNKNIDTLTPDIVVYIGGHIVSKRLKQWIRHITPKHVWHVSDEGRIIDIFQCVEHMLTFNCFTNIINKYQVTEHISEASNAYIKQWLDATSELPANNIDNWTDVSIVGKALSLMPQGWYLSLGNSSTVRHAQHFPLPPHTTVFCNRGVNGIDGSLSQAVGCALSTEQNVLCIIGDLSFFYDMNALWNIALPNNLRILLLNNGGGAIFSTLPGLEHSEHREPLVAAQHCMKAEGWAHSCNCNYYVATPNNIGILFEKSEKTIILEAFTGNQQQ